MSDYIKNKSIEDINIGMIGFGYIASGVYSLIREQKIYLAKKIKKNLNIVRIAEKDLKKIDSSSLEGLKDIKISSDVNDVLRDERIDIVVELIGGIDPAYDYVYRALSSGKYVVTANKDLLANRGGDLLAAAEKSNVDLLFEASVGGGIPIIEHIKSSLASK